MQFPAQSAETLAQIAIERLIGDIVAGALKPDAKLRIEELKERYDMGASPLREALFRLASLGFVTNSTRRGFRVAPMSRSDLEDITLVRQTIEAAALRRAMVSGSDDWEVGIVAALAKARSRFPALSHAGRQDRQGPLRGVRSRAQAAPRGSDRRLRLAATDAAAGRLLRSGPAVSPACDRPCAVN
jgi:DNA-binding GntR family transcriptional regulator